MRSILSVVLVCRYIYRTQKQRRLRRSTFSECRKSCQKQWSGIYIAWTQAQPTRLA